MTSLRLYRYRLRFLPMLQHLWVPWSPCHKASVALRFSPPVASIVALAPPNLHFNLILLFRFFSADASYSLFVDLSENALATQAQKSTNVCHITKKTQRHNVLGDNGGSCGSCGSWGNRCQAVLSATRRVKTTVTGCLLRFHTYIHIWKYVNAHVY